MFLIKISILFYLIFLSYTLTNEIALLNEDNIITITLIFIIMTPIILFTFIIIDFLKELINDISKYNDKTTNR